MSKVPVNFKSFTVVGTGQFPFDMLRYDMCWPKGSENASNLNPLRDKSGYVMVKRQVTLTTVKDTAPTVDRWASFGWHIMPGKE